MEHIILYAIVPIIVVMLAGYISGKKGIFSGANAKAFNKVVLDDACRRYKTIPYLPCGDNVLLHACILDL